MGDTVLLARSRYREHGGEDAAFEADRALLERNGHRVVVWERDNGAPRSRGPSLAGVLAAERPAIAHFHNTFPLLPPTVYARCRRAGVPVVQSLHNHRLVCPAVVEFRDGHACSDCLGRRVPWPGLVHACYRGSRPATALSASFALAQRATSRLVDRFLVPSAHAGAELASVLPAGRVVVRPNAVHPDFDAAASPPGRDPVVFVGRDAPEKGLDVARAAAARAGVALDVVQGASRREVIVAMQRARAVVVPSRSPETFGLVALEAFACGTPVIASRTGALPELVVDDENGWLFPPGDVAALAALLVREIPPSMSAEARATYEWVGAPEVAYERLRAVYRDVTNAAD